MSYLTPISRLEAENLAGCRNLRLARVSDIQTFPRIIAGQVNGDITFKPGAGWTRWVPIENTFGFDAKTVESQEGLLQDNNIRFSLPALDISEHVLNQAQLDNLLVLVEDMNGNEWLFGTPQRPMKFRYSKSTGTQGSGRNQFECFFLARPFCSRVLYRNLTVDETEYLQDVDGVIMMEVDGSQMEDIAA